MIPKSIISQLSEMLHSLKTITYEVASDPAKSAELVADLEAVLLKYQALKVTDVGLGGAAPLTRKRQRAQQPGAADKGSGSGSSSSSSGRGARRARKRQQRERSSREEGSVQPHAEFTRQRGPGRPKTGGAGPFPSFREVAAALQQEEMPPQPGPLPNSVSRC